MITVLQLCTMTCAQYDNGATALPLEANDMLFVRTANGATAFSLKSMTVLQLLTRLSERPTVL